MGYYVYAFANKRGEIIYVGQTTNFVERMKQHLNSRAGHLPKECYKNVFLVKFAYFEKKEEMSDCEKELIGELTPKYNTYGKNLYAEFYRNSKQPKYALLNWDSIEFNRKSLKEAYKIFDYIDLKTQLMEIQNKYTADLDRYFSRNLNNAQTIKINADQCIKK